MEDNVDPPGSSKRTTEGARGIHPAIRKVWLFSGIGSILFLAAIFGVMSFPLFVFFRKHPEKSLWMLLVAVALITVWVLIAIYTFVKINIQWKNWTYEVREHDVVLSWGVFWRTRRHVARDRIQHLDINSGPIDRRFGLVQVGIYTAGSHGTVGVIPGLTNAEAEDLRDMILESQADHI